MAPRTPRNRPSSVSFITLSLPRTSAAKWAGIVAQSSTQASTGAKPSRQNPSCTPTKAEPLLNETAPVSNLSPLHVPVVVSGSTSPAASILNNSTPSFTHSTISTAQSLNRSAVADQLPSPRSVDSVHGPNILEKDNEIVTADPERRSSTASFTSNPTRSSHRARKLTSKAQALAGTKLYSSVQTAPDLGNSVVEATEGEEELPIESSTNDDRPQTPARRTPEVVTLDSPIESVETIPIRSSARERKPTARAVEMENERTGRKRTGSPLISERVSKVAKTSTANPLRTSRLRLSVSTLGEGGTEKHSEKSATTSSPELVEDRADMEKGDPENEPRRYEDNPDQDGVGKQSTTIATIDHSNTERHLSKDISTQSQPDASQGEIEAESTAQACDLKCLSPSSRLLAFAKIASEWSDSDDDGDSDIDKDLDLEAAQTSSQATHTAWDQIREKLCHCTDSETSSNLRPEPRMNYSKSGHTNEHESLVNGNIRNQPRSERSGDDTPKLRPKRKADKPTALQKENEPPKVRIGTRRSNRSVKTQKLDSFEERMQRDYIVQQSDRNVTCLGTSAQNSSGPSEEQPKENLPPKLEVPKMPIRHEKIPRAALNAATSTNGFITPGKSEMPTGKTYNPNTKDRSGAMQTFSDIGSHDKVELSVPSMKEGQQNGSPSKIVSFPMPNKLPNKTNVELDEKSRGNGRHSATSSIRGPPLTKQEASKDLSSDRPIQGPSPQARRIKLRLNTGPKIDRSVQ